MNIVCVAACTAGIAHTYIAREKLIKGEERFTNKRIVRVKTEIVIKSPVQFLEKVEKSLGNK